KRGVIFIESINEVPEGSTLIFSAHGVSPTIRQDAAVRRLQTIDATCPLVTKVHLEVIRYAREGYTILLIGHARHPEVVGTTGEAPANVILIETADDARKVSVSDPVKTIVLTQTTLSVDDTKEIFDVLRTRFPEMKTPPSEDICYATRNRQKGIRSIASSADIVFVLGSKNSSNSNRLRDLSEQLGTPSHLIDRASDIQEEWLNGVETVGITAGASAPESLVEEVIEYLKARYTVDDIQEISAVDERVAFALPAEIKKRADELGKDLSQIAKHQISATQKMSV
ncbi:MAG TPA: 4-hydroxy-3-methylbut-2-enyl diphosphate reductase, partial [Patescibacteria group bacterium]|nr:4-hydroxy-3-methylbut-2-enyl diphosphate reductase [Patescibacteria group bacterium]